jgi:hypothetical protein
MLFFNHIFLSWFKKHKASNWIKIEINIVLTMPLFVDMFVAKYVQENILSSRWVLDVLTQKCNDLNYIFA